jgi:hypothetical protein
VALPDLGRIDAVLVKIGGLIEPHPGASLSALPAFGTRGWTRPAAGEDAQSQLPEI